MTAAVEGKVDDSSLQYLITTCSTALRHVDALHSSTPQLYPFLLELTSQRTFESEPEMLVAHNIWSAIPDESQVKLIGRRMLQFDALANHLQKLHYARLKTACLGSLGFLCAFEVFAHLAEDQPIILVLLCLAVEVRVSGSRNTLSPACSPRRTTMFHSRSPAMPRSAPPVFTNLRLAAPKSVTSRPVYFNNSAPLWQRMSSPAPAHWHQKTRSTGN
jgi:hypothetical protein